MNYTASSGYRGGAAYLGKDILGSVRSTSNEYGLLEDRYEYDAFGKPYKGELNEGMNLGYTGKPYDTATGMYNYGYRDYKPEQARFTTVDPIRDGSNWFAYVNNDPVNWIDPLGLNPFSDALNKVKETAAKAVDVIGKTAATVGNTIATVLLKDDNSSQITTYGISVSGTTAGFSGNVGFGVYVDNKNDLLPLVSASLMMNPVTAPVGVLLAATNIKEAGKYVDGSGGVGLTLGDKKYSGSVSASLGIYTSKEAAQGPYTEIGGSGGRNIAGVPLSVGVDAAFGEGGKPIGSTISVGLGGGDPLEAHARFGVTAFVPLYKKGH